MLELYKKGMITNDIKKYASAGTKQFCYSGYV